MASRTLAVYQKDGTLRNLATAVLSCHPITTLPDDDRSFFKAAADTDYIVATRETIFHPQGGGQPSDTGSIKSSSPGSDIQFDVKSVRKLPKDRILHQGTFTSPAESSSGIFSEGQTIVQAIDDEKRNFHSRLHTAGHLLGLAVRQLAESSIPELGRVTEGKAQHTPGSAAVEYSGLIAGEHKKAIQDQANELVKQGLPVNVFWWDEKTTRSQCTAVPAEMAVPEEGVFRVVEVEGVGSYPCGGTHLPSTRDVGGIVVKKISRSKGVSRISYDITDAA
ncbi:threonyl/alanyl tRNA synthetase [Mytilinidion resinicola]|uniref:Threonyl/alanyl tRNA synthetase n=1 Tax=Mytilinidion resinicola TaxID=574789 RepID=A0A6A6Y3F6_9PEZI|nr:threonyl/alanyl tRNA synthetase [Mytilinidion resinicola]KAF2802554.1 threonyl/alanyl tRNA synthetase [Mytilinidion resinicola]